MQTDALRGIDETNRQASLGTISSTTNPSFPPVCIRSVFVSIRCWRFIPWRNYPSCSKQSQRGRRKKGARVKRKEEKNPNVPVCQGVRHTHRQRDRDRYSTINSGRMEKRARENERKRQKRKTGPATSQRQQKLILSVRLSALCLVPDTKTRTRCFFSYSSAFSLLSSLLFSRLLFVPSILFLVFLYLILAQLTFSLKNDKHTHEHNGSLIENNG